jgi:membrane-bound lytic murein transglycosylase D
MRFFAVALIFYGVAASYAQTPQVPHKMRFADMTLTIRDDARREIQKDVDALTKSPKYFEIKAERARTYFPLIEKIFEEERLPTDFKYLVLQESALIPDAVSVSNAVGFWQFKDFTAMEMGLRVDNQVDERMNIISSTRAAAKYLKQNNYLFNNWLYALQSYQMGAGGVKREVGDDHNGARHMEITSETYWYVKKFIAHKVAFENVVKGEPQLKMQVIEVADEKKLSELARQLAMNESELLNYNKWIRAGTIPNDRPYSLLIPYGKLTPELAALWTASSNPVAEVEMAKGKKEADGLERVAINGLDAVKGKPGERASQMAARLNISVSSFLKYNDITIDHIVRSDVYYFIQKKKKKSDALTHTVAPGEDLWLLSQRYGVSLKRLQKMNGLPADQKVEPGDVVWLTTKRPVRTQPEAAVQSPVVASIVADNNEMYFDWEIKLNTEKPEARTIGEPEIIRGEKKVADEYATPENSGRAIHTVAAGETLYSISKQYQVSVADLVTWNRLDWQAGLKSGQQVIISPGSDQPQQPKDVKGNAYQVHEVKASDTLYSVARQYNVSIKEIMDWNGKQDFTLSIGEKLKIYTR